MESGKKVPKSSSSPASAEGDAAKGQSSGTNGKPSAPAGHSGHVEGVQIVDNREDLKAKALLFAHPSLSDALAQLTRPRREGSNASFFDIRTPSAKVDPVFRRSLERALAEYVSDRIHCGQAPEQLTEDVRRWVLEAGYADELSAVARRASRRQSSEARQHILAAFHPVLIHELLRAEPRRADPDDAEGFLEAELFELERDDGPLERVAGAIIDEMARQQRRSLSQPERTLLARELRNAL